MNKIIINIFLGLSFFLITCQKDESAYVRGTVLECGNENPITNATITLSHRTKDKNGPNEYEIIGTTISDQNGNYKINYHRKHFNTYIVECYADINNYYSIDQETSLNHKKVALTFSFPQYAYVKVRIKKNSNSSNYVKCWVNSRDYGGQTPVIQNGNSFDTTFVNVFRVISTCGLVHIGWRLYPADILTTEDLHLNKGDTLTYFIQYN